MRHAAVAHCVATKPVWRSNANRYGLNVGAVAEGRSAVGGDHDGITVLRNRLV